MVFIFLLLILEKDFMWIFLLDVVKVVFKMVDFEVDLKLSFIVIGGMYLKMVLWKFCFLRMYIYGFSNDVRYLK